MASTKKAERPPFDELPLDKDGPPGNAWGLYGPNDELGALNMLTPETVVAAAQEIKTGERVSLDWHLNKPSRPSFDRPPFEVKLRNNPGRAINDDELHFNTQCSTQWDGFRHFGFQGVKRFYGNRTQDDVDNTDVLGIDVWAENGGVVGRGALLDYVSFCNRHSITVDPFSSSSIPLEHIKQMVLEQDITFQAGDILVLRVGFTAAYNALDPIKQDALAQRPTPDFLGVEPTSDMLRWLWDSGFAAVVSDSPSFERAPVEGLWTGAEIEDHIDGGGLLHQVLIGGWGMPIGEMFDLEKLSETCQRLNRWHFFMSSVPLKVPGGVASPPNAVAIF